MAKKRRLLRPKVRRERLHPSTTRTRVEPKIPPPPADPHTISQKPADALPPRNIEKPVGRRRGARRAR